MLSSFPAFLLSGFPAFLISCFPAFLLFCFPSLRFSCFPAFTFFDVYTRLCKALCPHPGEVVYLTYLFLVSLVWFAFLAVLGFSWRYHGVFLAFLGLSCLLLVFLVFSWFFLAFLLSYPSLLGVCLPSCRCPPSLRLIDSLIRQAICCLIILSINVSNGPTNPHLRQLIS